MKCKEAYFRICENLDADPNSAKCRQVLKHLESCPDCSAFLDSVKKTISLYRAEPAPHMPAGAHKRLVKAIDLEWRSRPARRS